MLGKLFTQNNELFPLNLCETLSAPWDGIIMSAVHRDGNNASRKNKGIQAGAELGQAQPKLGLNFIKIDYIELINKIKS